MGKALFPEGIITIEVDGHRYKAEYIGQQRGFDCVVCHKGENCHTFNILQGTEEEYDAGKYETWGFGRSHLHHVKLITTA